MIHTTYKINKITDFHIALSYPVNQLPARSKGYVRDQNIPDHDIPVQTSIPGYIPSEMNFRIVLQ